MPAKSSICVVRRSQLSMIASTPLIMPVSISLGGCGAPVRRMPDANLPRQKPQRLAILPTKEVREIRLEHLSSAHSSSAWSTGMSRTALWDNQSSRSRDFTRVLRQNGLIPNGHLTRQLVASATDQNVELVGLTSAPAIETAISNWAFDFLAAKADAIVFLEIGDIAFSSKYTNTFWPILQTTMTVASTRDNTLLGEQDYRVRINAEPVDQRDQLPDAQSRFGSVNELMANPRLAIKVLHVELDKVAQLMASDLEKLTRGQEMKWGSV